MGRDIFFYSISIDPETDTPERMKQYAETFGAGPGWLFLTGLPEDINEIRYRLGDRSRFLGDHRNDVLLGNGFTGQWQRDLAMGDLDRLILTIQSLNPDRVRHAPRWRAAPHDQLEAIELTGPPGEPSYLKACAGCHSIGEGNRVGPDLAGVTQRRRAGVADQLHCQPGQDPRRQGSHCARACRQIPDRAHALHRRLGPRGRRPRRLHRGPARASTPANCP